MEIDMCREKMYQYEEEERKCIVDHPGFNEGILNEYVLDLASLGLKTKGKRNYSLVFRDGHKTRHE
jgi:hypothetical protein